MSKRTFFDFRVAFICNVCGESANWLEYKLFYKLIRIIIEFSLEQRLGERTTMLRYTNTARLVFP